MAEDSQSILRPVLIAIPPIDGLRTPEQVQRQRDYARRALRRSAELSGAPLEGWTQDPDGRPLPNDGWHWSISHKRQWAAGVVSRAPVGIDIEHVIPRRDEALFDVIADAEEWAIIGDRSWENFYRIWTAKEAVLKANGFGIGKLGKCRLAVASGPQLGLTFGSIGWSVQQLLHGECLAAVTSVDALPQWVSSDLPRDMPLGPPRTVFRDVKVPWRMRVLPIWKRVFPEIDVFDDASVGAKAFNDVVKAMMWKPMFFVYVLAYSAIVAVLLRTLATAGQSWFEIPERAMALVGGLLSGFSVFIAILFPFRRRIRHTLRQRLIADGIPVCMVCGYDLRGQDNPRCPECGTAF